MRVLRIQGLGGASGDMLLAALIDLGVDPGWIEMRLGALGLEPFVIEASPFESHGLRGRCVRVVPAEATPHAHGHGAGAADAHGHAHVHRSWADIRSLIEAADLPDRARRMALDAFRRLAVAEGAVHGCPPDAVHFHEVGALDSIVDMVGACLALDRLDVGAVRVDPLPLGRGTVRCAHGVYPVPAPATAELLRGFPVAEDEAEGEQVTPTGAAVLMSWRAMAEAPAGGCLLAVGQGFGHRRYADRPNLLRALLLETEPAPAEAQACLQIETLVDDCSPEWIGALCGRLREAGALDAWCTPAYTKRERPGVALHVLCAADRREAMLDLVFRESTTFGVREQRVRRTTLAREVRAVSTPWGAVRVKIGTWQNAPVTMAPEWRDCEACARAHDVAVRLVFEAAQQAARGGQWSDDPRQ